MPPRQSIPRRKTAAKPVANTIDLDKVGEELGFDPLIVTLGGVQFEMAHLKSLDIWDSMEEDTEGMNTREQIMHLLELSLGDEQWERFRALSLTIGQIDALAEHYNAYCGVSAGES